MTEQNTTPYGDVTARLMAAVAERDAVLASVHSSYAQALAAGTVGDLYSGYLEQRGSAINRFSQDAIAIRKEYAQLAPADAPPLPDSPGPVPAFPCPKPPAYELSVPQHQQPPPNQASSQVSMGRPPAPVPDPARRYSGWRMARGALVLIVVGTAFAIWVPSWFKTDSSSSSSSYSSVVSSSRKVLYEVEGTATTVNITYQTPSGTAQGADKKVPLGNKASGTVGITLAMERGDFVYISAQNQGSSGTVTCRITVDGVVVSKVTSSGAYTIASCSGKAP